MFCINCGTENPDGMSFCRNCGARLMAKTSEQKQQGGGSGQTQTWAEGSYSMNVPKKKKFKKLFFILGIVAFIVIVLAIFGGERIDYIASVKGHAPFKNSYGLNATFSDVLNKYMESPKWKEGKADGDIHYVEISGTFKGTKNKLAVTIKVSQHPDMKDKLSIVPESVIFNNGEEEYYGDDAVNVLLGIWGMYDQGYKDLSENMDGGDSDSSITYSNGKATIGETQTVYTPHGGNIEVTVNYVEFIDKYVDRWGTLTYPDNGNVFLRADITVNNIDTKESHFIGRAKLIYDDIYEYGYSGGSNNSISIKPLTASQNGDFIFDVPMEVMTSGKSLVLNIDNCSNDVMRYLIR